MVLSLGVSLPLLSLQKCPEMPSLVCDSYTLVGVLGAKETGFSQMGFIFLNSFLKRVMCHIPSQQQLTAISLSTPDFGFTVLSFLLLFNSHLVPILVTPVSARTPGYRRS